ncbi:hypothetical protein H5410_039953 [Solanum commersonii]|uniref:Uncharacterized protein n=1 Tax=Solanum commersonii TaxID=4109 RepID=A0A9J5XPL5_SOLCO|nr:hypothetical protein H5410_039953 [Solanum commersonii]
MLEQRRNDMLLGHSCPSHLYRLSGLLSNSSTFDLNIAALLDKQLGLPSMDTEDSIAPVDGGRAGGDWTVEPPQLRINRDCS